MAVLAPPRHGLPHRACRLGPHRARSPDPCVGQRFAPTSGPISVGLDHTPAAARRGTRCRSGELPVRTLPATARRPRPDVRAGASPSSRESRHPRSLRGGRGWYSCCAGSTAIKAAPTAATMRPNERARIAAALIHDSVGHFSESELDGRPEPVRRYLRGAICRRTGRARLVLTGNRA